MMPGQVECARDACGFSSTGNGDGTEFPDGCFSDIGIQFLVNEFIKLDSFLPGSPCHFA